MRLFATLWFLAGAALVLVACTDSAAIVCAACSDTSTGLRAERLTFVEQPTSATAWAAMRFAVAIEDPAGNTMTRATDTVTVSIGANPGSGTLSGTTSAVAVNGVATFTTLRIDRAGTRYTLTAAAAGLPGATSAPFDIASPATQPALHVITVTSGASLDRDGYSVCIDPGYDDVCSFAAAIGLNGDLTVPVLPGDHYVELDDVAGNCGVGGGSFRWITVSGTTDVPILVTCAAAGTVRVAVTTTGTDLDPDGYVVCFDPPENLDYEDDCSRWVWVRANDAVTVAYVIAGLHTMSLYDVAGNCAVSGATTRTVSVPVDATVDVAFDVACMKQERIGFRTGQESPFVAATPDTSFESGATKDAVSRGSMIGFVRPNSRRI